MSALLVALAVAAAGCGGAETMNGFPPAEARAVVDGPSRASACDLRRGRLVLEIERVLVREYPPSNKEVISLKKQPLLLLWVSLPSGGPGAVALTPLVAPEEYQAGQEIRWFEGKRLLEQPARLLGGRVLDLRLAENNRTAEPEWRRVAGEVGSGVSSAAGQVGVSAPPTSVVNRGLDLLQKLDRDDLILRWSLTTDEVMKALGEPRERHLLRYRLATTRKVPSPPSSPLPSSPPSAEMELIFYWEPEPGCSWEPSR